MTQTIQPAIPHSRSTPNFGTPSSVGGGAFGSGSSLGSTRGLHNTAKVFGMAAGASHSACVDNRGICYTWGYGANGRLGHGDTNDRLEPTPVAAFAKLRSKYTFLLRDVTTKVAEARRCVGVRTCE